MTRIRPLECISPSHFFSLMMEQPTGQSCSLYCPGWSSMGNERTWPFGFTYGKQGDTWIYYFNQTMKHWGRSNFSKGSQSVLRRTEYFVAKRWQIHSTLTRGPISGKNQGMKGDVEVWTTRVPLIPVFSCDDFSSSRALMLFQVYSLGCGRRFQKLLLCMSS